jgi:hypothetical protein
MSARQVFSMSALVVSAFLAVEGLVFGQDAALPPGVKAVWDMSKAHRDTTPTREQVCINGLWRWQPAKADAPKVPAADWGFFKVPGCWPGITDYMQKDCQTVFAHPSWRGVDMGAISSAWYQREIVVPKEWDSRRITLYAEYVNSSATVFLDGKEIGTILFPAGELDLTADCRPGEKQLLSLRVKAMPLKELMLAYNDTNTPKEVRGSVARRGLCGDVYLIGAPKGARITGVQVDTSVRKWQITVRAALDQLQPEEKYTLKAVVSDGGRTVKEFTSEPFAAADLADGRESFTAAWKPEKLWDIHTPGNMYSVQVSLMGGAGQVLDVFTPQRFGFREFWIDGRDFYLNGTRIFLSAIQLVNPLCGAAWATYDAVCEGLQRLKSFGINYVYLGNYGCEPGTHLTFAEMLRAADDMGMLVGLSQPHFRDYDWKSPDADRKNSYARHAAFYVGVAGNHPSIVFYATSHNTTGYVGDMNPDLIDGVQDPRDQAGKDQAKVALRAEAIIRGLDPTRIVYHHSSGNLGAMHTVNFYPNFVPIQELDDWFEHWATVGVKPLFLCEFAAPGCVDFTMYRGWYKGKRDFGNGPLPWELCMAEWNSQFLGDAAFRISEVEKQCLRWESKQFRAGALWHRWDYPYPIGSQKFEEQYPAVAMYMTDNWRAFRTWGMSAFGPSEYRNDWKLRDGVDKGRREFKVDWEHLQRPGLSPDYIEDRLEHMDLAFDRADWVATPAAEVLYRNNMPLLAYIAGKPAAFTSKDHNFLPGQTVEKQLVVINNSRETVSCDCSWSLSLPSAARGAKEITVPTGDQERIPLTFALPADLAPGAYEIAVTAKFSTGETQTDTFVVDVLPAAGPVQAKSKIALFDPMGETAKLLKDLGVEAEPVGADADLAGYGLFIVGKGALTPTGAAPDISHVRDGLKVILFEQTAETLEKRFGFRTAEYGLRWVFQRMSDHPLLAGLRDEHLRNWCGAATLLPARLNYRIGPPYYTPTVDWCGIPATRIWRCGNRGNVASALIEKPGRGNFLPILGGGFSLQYSPLMEYREGAGMVLLCQMDVTGRTEKDPAAEALTRNILKYAAAWKSSPARKAVYVGEAAGQSWLESAGIAPEAYRSGQISADEVLVVGPGGSAGLKADAADIAGWLKAGGEVLAMALDENEAGAFLPGGVQMKKSEHIAAYFDPFPCGSLLAGVGPADVHSREPRQIPLVAAGATPFGDGVLALGDTGKIVFSQLAPWQYDVGQQNLRRSFRHLSFLMSRLLGNMGVSGTTPLLERFHSPVAAGQDEKRFLDGFYLDVPVEWDDPYRCFRW